MQLHTIFLPSWFVKEGTPDPTWGFFKFKIGEIMEQEIAQSSLDIFKGKFEIKNFLSSFFQHYTWVLPTYVKGQNSFLFLISHF